MGVVMAAYDPELDRKVALKLIRPERKGNLAQSRMLREAQAMAKLSHPNVVQIYDVGAFGDQTYLAMELIDGSTIRTWLDSEPRAWPEILEAFIAAGRGLAAAHEHGIVHRDFKPDNVLVSEDGRVRVADFGIAGWSGDEVADDAEHAVAHSFLRQPLTSTGAVIGTPRYMAPEQHAGEPAGVEADQFSFCVALHEALFGALPFAGGTVTEIVAEIEARRVHVPPDARYVPSWLGRLVRKGLAFNPEDRHPSVVELIDALERFPRTRRRTWRLAAAGVVVVGAVSVSPLLAGPAETPPCTAGAERIEDRWGARRDEVVERLGFEDGSQTTDQIVVASLEEYAERWTRTEREVCLDHKSGSTSAVLLDKAMGCLDRRFAALDTVVELALDPSVQVSALAGVVAKLPPVATCSDREALLRLAPPPEDPDAATVVSSVRNGLGEVEVLHNAGKVDVATEKLGALEASADGVGYRPLQAEFGLVAGRLAMDRGDWGVATRELTIAAHRGVAAGMDAVAAEALARLVFVVGISNKDPGRGLEHVPWARALLERLGEPRELDALLSNNIGTIHAVDGRREEATSAFARAVELSDGSGDTNPIDFSSYLANLAMNTRDSQKRDALFERSCALLDTTLGPEHLERLDGMVRWAQFTESPTEALARIEPVCALLALREHDDPMRSYHCSLRQAELHDRLGHREQAVSSLDVALPKTKPGQGGHNVPAYVQALQDRTLGYRALLTNDPVSALAPLQRAEDALRPKEEIPWIALDLADVTLLQARAHQALGQPIDTEALRRAITVYEDRMAMNEDQAPRYRRRLALELIDQSQAQTSAPP